MSDLDYKGVGEHLPVIVTAVVSLVVIVGTVMKGYGWLTESWRSSMRDEVKGLNKDLDRLEKRLDRLEQKLESSGYGHESHSIRGQRPGSSD